VKIGIMGGTFDPIHIGHLIAAEAAREQAGLDEVWFIPTGDPPLKEKAPSVDASQRFEMVSLAVSAHDRFRALDIELRRDGVSYSVDTVAELCKQYPGYTFSYIIGSDRINDLPKWHRIEELAQMACFIGLERPEEPPQLEALPSYLKQALQLVDMPGIGVSSTAIREKLASGHSIRYLVPEPVGVYIRRHGLYGSRNDD